MKYMVQIKTSPEEAEKFINSLASQGYTPVRVTKHELTNVHFKIDGETTILYSVTVMEDCAYIGVRPQ